MNLWVLTKGSGYYVNLPGSEKSYTTNKAAAKRFASKDEAERGKCGNEWAEPL